MGLKEAEFLAGPKTLELLKADAKKATMREQAKLIVHNAMTAMRKSGLNRQQRRAAMKKSLKNQKVKVR